jgi:hypothetical protein
MFVFAPNPRKPEIILFFKLATVVVAVERSAARQSCGGAHVGAAAHTSTLIGVCEITDMPAEVSDAWFIESLRKNVAPEMKPLWVYELQYDSVARFRQIKSAAFSIFFF